MRYIIEKDEILIGWTESLQKGIELIKNHPDIDKTCTYSVGLPGQTPLAFVRFTTAGKPAIMFCIPMQWNHQVSDNNQPGPTA